MIIGTGIDIIELDRIKNAIERRPRFIDRIFTEDEKAYFEKKNYKIESIAVTYAAKEAMLKALGTGLRNVTWRDIEVVRDRQGAPSINLYGKAKEKAHSLKIELIHVSLSHSKAYGIASVVCEGK
jgi:holo-[acyl-carrier protein] synthase